MAKQAVDVQKMKKSAKEVSELLKILSHPERLMVLCQLTKGETSAGLLQERSELSPSAFSQHLSVLRKHHLVVVRKEAQQVFYSLSGHKASEVIASLQAIFCQ